MFFGVCKVTKECSGILLLSNPTDVPAKWNVQHEPINLNTKSRISVIRVSGYNERGPETDDPSVFEISPSSGFLLGPTISVFSATGAPAKDVNREKNCLR